MMRREIACNLITGKIFNVHFRNIKGQKLDFMEAFPDEGDMDMPRALAAYRDVGYPYMLMPDHVPQIDGRDPSGAAFAYCYGYIQALLDALVRGRDRRGGGYLGTKPQVAALSKFLP